MNCIEILRGQSKTSAHIAQHDITTIVTQQWYVCAKVAEGLLDLSQGLGVLSFASLSASNDSDPQTLEAMIDQIYAVSRDSVLTNQW